MLDFVRGDFSIIRYHGRNNNSNYCVSALKIAAGSGDVVFANSTCYGDDLMNKLAQGAAALKEGAIVVTMTDPVPSPAFEVLEEVRTTSLMVPILPLTFRVA